MEFCGINYLVSAEPDIAHHWLNGKHFDKTVLKHIRKHNNSKKQHNTKTKNTQKILVKPTSPRDSAHLIA